MRSCAAAGKRRTRHDTETLFQNSDPTYAEIRLPCDASRDRGSVVLEREFLFDAVRAAADPGALFDRVIVECLALLPQADGASLEVFQDSDTLEYIAAAGTLEQFKGLRIPAQDSLSGLSARMGQVLRCDDSRTDSRVNSAAVETTGVISMLCVPLAAGIGTPAVLKMSATYSGAFADHDAEALQLLAGFLSVVLRAGYDIGQSAEHLLLTTKTQDADSDPRRREQSLRTARFVANVVHPGLAERVDGVAAIESIIATKDLAIHLQPIVNLQTGTVSAVEALARFSRTPHHAPDWWFTLAGSVGLGNALQMLAVEKALETFELLPSHVRLAVNASAELIIDPRFAECLVSAPMHRLTVEITEHQHVSDYSKLLAATQNLRNMGARISVDDAGSGYSGLHHIRQLVPDVLKLDRDLTIGVHEDPVRQALTVALVGFAQRIDAVIIAEGIEVYAEADMMRSLGVQFGQGYLLGRPQPASAMFAAG